MTERIEHSEPGDREAILRALLDEDEPLTQYFIGLKVGWFVGDDAMWNLAREGLVQAWAMWWPGQAPSSVPSFALTRHGRAAVKHLTGGNDG